MTPALEINDLTVRYGDVVGLERFSITLPAGGVVALVGENGAGKSSVVNALAGLVPSTGSVRMHGVDLARMAPERRADEGLGVCLEGRRLFVDLTVEENLRVATISLPRSRRRPALGEAFDLFPRLRDRRGQRAGTLSGGEQQMVALARALIREPRVLLLDEPSLGLAPWLAREILQRIWGLLDSGTSILVAEQNDAILPSTEMDAARLYHGSVVATGPLSDVSALDPAAIQARLRGAERSSE